MTLTRGVDVSFLTDWAALQRDHGISFGVARCMRSTEGKDPSFDGNWQRMGGLDNFVRMSYAFASPALGPDAVDDARIFWDYVTAASAGPLLPTDYFWLDLEQSTLTQEETNDWAEAWYDEFTRLNPYWPGIYNGGYLMNRTGIGLNKRFGRLWYPRPETQYNTAWPTTFTPKLPLGATSWADTNWERPPDFWQCAFFFKVPGYPDHDANVSPLTLDQLRALNQEPRMDINPDQKISLLKPAVGGGTIRTAAGDILGLDSITVKAALGWAAAGGFLAPQIKAAVEQADEDLTAAVNGIKTTIEGIPGVDLSATVEALAKIGTDLKDLRSLLPNE